MGYEKPTFCGLNRFLPILGQSSTSAEPCERTFNAPSFGDDLEAFGLVCPFDDLDCPTADFLQSAPKFRPLITSARKDMAQPGVGVSNGSQHPFCTVTVLNISAMDDTTDQQANRVGDDVSLAAFYLLASVIS